MQRDAWSCDLPQIAAVFSRSGQWRRRRLLRQSCTKSKSGFRSTARIWAVGPSGRSCRSDCVPSAAGTPCWLNWLASAGDSSAEVSAAAEVVADDDANGVHPFLPADEDFSDCAVPFWVVGAAVCGDVSVMGCGKAKNFGRPLRICAGACVWRFSASIYASVSFSVAARSCSPRSAASSACFCVEIVAWRRRPSSSSVSQAYNAVVANSTARRIPEISSVFRV